MTNENLTDGHHRGRFGGNGSAAIALAVAEGQADVIEKHIVPLRERVAVVETNQEHAEKLARDQGHAAGNAAGRAWGGFATFAAMVLQYMIDNWRQGIGAGGLALWGWWS